MEAFEQGYEAVIAHPRQGVRPADVRLQPIGQRAQQVLAERAAHLLDRAQIMVRLDREQPERVALALGPGDRALEALGQEQPVGEPRQRIVAGVTDPKPLETLALDRGDDGALHRRRRGQALRQKILGAAADRRAGEQHVLGPEAAIHDDRQVGRMVVHAADRGQTAGIRQHQIEQDGIEAALVEPRPGLAQASDVGQLEACVLAQKLRGDAGIARTVLDQQNPDGCGHHNPVSRRQQPGADPKAAFGIATRACAIMVNKDLSALHGGATLAGAARSR